jgi:hypothetical protein
MGCGRCDVGDSCANDVARYLFQMKEGWKVEGIVRSGVDAGCARDKNDHRQSSRAKKGNCGCCTWRNQAVEYKLLVW